MTEIADRGELTQSILDGAHRYDEDGILWRMLDVPDISDESPTRLARQARITELNQEVAADDSSTATSVDSKTHELVMHSRAAQEVFSNPAMHAWRRDLVPSALALYPLQFPDSAQLPNGVPIDPVSREYFTDSIDAIGIRTRAKIMANVAADYVGTAAGEEKRWVSLACGAAVPVLEALGSSAAQVHLDLVDNDESVLGFAAELAENNYGLSREQIAPLQRNLVRELMRSDRLINEIGQESADFVDALGIFEYFEKEYAEAFLQQAYRLVKPGGAIVIANMLTSHPELEFNQKCIGWPLIRPRSPEQIVDIIKNAGIDPTHATASVASDGVYAVMEIKKPGGQA